MKINSIKGIGEKTEKVFYKAGVETTDDLLKYYPRNYDIFEMPVWIRDLESDMIQAVKATVCKNIEVRRIRNLQVLTAVLKDDTGMMIKATWFNATYLRNTLKLGSVFIFRGVVKARSGSNEMAQPKIYTIDEYKSKLEQMQPIYPLVNGMTNNIVIKAVKSSIEVETPLTDYMPDSIKEKFGLEDLDKAIKDIHFPANRNDMKYARKRLVFDEFFLFVCALRRFRNENEIIRNNYILEEPRQIRKMVKSLPYKLTNAQIRTWEEIKKDMAGNKVMNRLIQGDVGSGKTIIAVMALLTAALNGCQGAMMAPTEVLARQHFESFMQIIKENNLSIIPVLLVGSMRAKEKREANELIESGKANIIIGTHALIQEKVKYKNLAVVVTDEQHRFGVRQREAINIKGDRPHVIVMSATPIPRTLAIIMYGDLDISIIDELPANRLPIKNCVVGPSYRATAYRFMEQQINQGRQVYVICPTVEYSEAVEGENVIDYSDKLKGIFSPSVKIEFLHGRMKSAEKNDVMERFSKNEIQILVSTTVVEVGVNVPNATVMMIENAERFGLAGLHQLRGRVGRGKHQSYCIFINGSAKKNSSERLDILVKSNDGFEIASEDLKLRGPGDFFGVRQSGDMEFRLGDIYTDSNILKQVAEVSNLLENNEITLSNDEKQRLDKIIDKYTKDSADKINI